MRGDEMLEIFTPYETPPSEADDGYRTCSNLIAKPTFGHLDRFRSRLDRQESEWGGAPLR
jgi:hypothetical protein